MSGKPVLVLSFDLSEFVSSKEDTRGFGGMIASLSDDPAMREDTRDEVDLFNEIVYLSIQLMHRDND